MFASFSPPLLLLSTDAVREHHGGESLPGLWTLFSKCKESLQDGRRLENISWRLWYREMAASQYTPLTPKSVSPVLSEKSGATGGTFPTPHGETIRSDDYSQLPEMHRSVLLASSPVPHVRTTSHQIDDRYTKPFSLSFGRPRSVGKIICDLLPNQILFPSAKFASSTCPQMSLPTPTSDKFPIITSITTATATTTTPPQVAEKSPVALHPSIPSVCLPSTPPDTDHACPRVVVVDPTPNPTPHPTPPTTPVFKSATTTFTPAPAPTTHLLPPLPLPAMARVSPKPPTPSLPSSSRPSQLPPQPSNHHHPTATPKPDSLKPSDRRFFLQQSPDGDGESPEREDFKSEQKSVSDRASSESSPPKDSAESKRAPVRVRKGKEVARHITVRPKAAHNGRPPQLRRAATLDGKTRPTFSVGSTSSHGSKGAVSSKGTQKVGIVVAAPAAAKTPKAKVVAVSPPKTANPPQRRRVVVASTSSEYETTDTDDESWAEEDTSVEDGARTKEDVQLREAAMEVKRQRELFAKVPKRSYSNLNRTKSGLLSQLLNPDPTIFPMNHPYRTSFSTQDFSQLPHNSNNKAHAHAYAPAPGLHTSKSAAVLPMTALVTAQVGSVTSGNMNGHRPKGRPQGQEMEDDTDSADENMDDGIQVSRSFAHQKLAELAGQQKFGKTNNTMAANTATMTMSTTTTTTTSTKRPVLHHVATAPIPLCHPYNLPAPAPPSTPRTTRRQMLQTELSESLRRNLLWERQVSNVNGGVRRQSSGAIGGLRPLTSISATTAAKENGNEEGEVSNRRSASEKQDEKQRAMARHRSWADDYHSKGW